MGSVTINASACAACILFAPQVTISGAEPAHCNGVYIALSTHNDRLKYRNRSGAAIYFDDGWKLSVQGAPAASAYSIESFDSIPPAGKWVRADGDGACRVVAPTSMHVVVKLVKSKNRRVNALHVSFAPEVVV